MPEEKFIDITHFSSVPKVSKNGTLFLITNLVFKALTEEFREECDHLCQEHVPGLIITDIKKHDDYFENLYFEEKGEPDEAGLVEFASVSPSGLKFEDFTQRGLTYNHFQVLRKIEKFDCYRYHNYLQDNQIVRGTLRMMDSLSRGNNPSRFASYGVFTTCLKTLEMWWD